MFDPVDPKQSLPQMELGILQYWKEEDIFQRSIKQRSSVQGRAWHDAKSGDPEDTFSFYDGPPFATGLPHYGHLLAGTIKDVIPRYQTMRGKVVQRRFGWDCHGLPVENLIEKEHGIEGREQIEEMGVGKFNELCCCSVQRFTREWQEVVERMGRWVDMNWDYRTMDPDYMESIWWVFKQLHDKGLVYEGHKPMHICPRCVTPLSNFEVTQGYKDITDTSVTMKFELLEKETERKESKDSKEAKDLVLRAPENEEELAKLHELRVQEIFEPYHPDTKYDRNHPDDKHPDHELLVLMAKKKVVGTVRVDWLDEHRVAFRLIAIDRKMQGKGLGSELLQRAEDIAREKGCSEILLNAENSVIPFYKKHGFAETSQWEESPSVGSTPMSKSLGTKEKTFVLAWTTTPWTLPGNLFLAVGPKIKYTKVEFEGNHYILAKSAVEKIFKGKEYKVKGNMAANTLAGKHFKPLFPYFSETYKKDKNVFRIVAADFVATDEGTGIVHIAPGFGEDDYQIGRREKVDVLQHVTMDGKFVPEVTDFAGMDVKPIDDPGKTDRKVVDWLEKHGLLFSKEPYRHSYPHCWRCDSPLLNYATSSWFVSIEKIKEKLLSNNAKTEWIPAHLRDGRFGKWLEGARDWAISRNRYWGTPLPIWRNQETGDTEVLGSRDDLMAHAPERFTKVTVVRHGESEGNLTPIYQGIEPGTNLTKQGKEQAQATAKLLAGRGQKSENRIQIPVEIIYCSPLARTQQTAEAIAKETGAEIIVDDRLREVNFGEYEGKTVDFNDLAFVKARRAHKLEEKSPESIYHFPGMETWNDVQKRLSSFMVEMLPRHRGKHVVVVTHADVVQNAKHFFTREDPLKISHQPYPSYAEPRVFYWDHERGAQMDLHKDTVDGIVWNGGKQGPFKRIPEVLDCWFESGAMPYAQSHYPFEAGSCSLDLESSRRAKNQEPLPPGFPADFIAEGVDQTRGWFYTLMVLSSALFDEPAFKHCVVNGIVLAEDGKKMSKRLKNYPEPTEIVEKYGADAIRFTLMSSPAVRGEDLRMSEKLVAESLRNVLLPLWNTYSFFVTYANAATFEPVATRKASAHPLDRWILAEVQDLVNRMTEQLDQYDLSATCAELHDTIDALTNWYVRLSRRRFAGKTALEEGESASAIQQLDGAEEDRLDALRTLYDVLISLTQLLAPFCPFITDAIYLNLVPEEHVSVHLTDWPEVRALKKEELALLQKTRLLRTIVSLGLSIRSEQKIKSRQPLASATVAVPPALAKTAALSDEDVQLLRNELNVKQLTFTEDPGSLATAVALVDARKAGPRLGARVQEVIKAGKAGEFAQQDDGSVLILDEVFSPDEVQIVYRGEEGRNIAADHGIVVSMETTLTDDLKLEGLARDLIRAVQRLRKEAGLEFTDTITLAVDGADALMQLHGNLIAHETRSQIGENGGEKHTIDLKEQKVTVRFEKK